jgi:hypothetical protein
VFDSIEYDVFRAVDGKLQFGKVGPNAFTMDVRSPLSPLFAFCMSVAALERKLPLAFEL